MPAASLLALLDDIATVLDDVAVLTKVATKKTAGVLGDDLALNAQQVAGVRASRELPVVWAVFKGSLLNKAILVPAALLISAFVPWLVMPLMMLGGAFLCFEGAEKVWHKLAHRDQEQARKKEVTRAVADPDTDMVAFERDKIRGAIRTDFILSAEIIVISLGVVADVDFGIRVAVLVAIALLITFGVYGLVAGIVKLDDAGLALSRREGEGGAARAQRAFGRGILRAAPWLMKGLSIAGTAAMFLVGGGILVHGIGPVHHLVQDAMAAVGGVAGTIAGIGLEGLFGLLAGAMLVAVFSLYRKLRGTPAPAH